MLGEPLSDRSAELALRLPQAHCVFCAIRTPHVHERHASSAFSLLHMQERAAEGKTTRTAVVACN
jgi:hypothetical protein